MSQPKKAWKPRCCRCDKQVDDRRRDLRYGCCIDCLAQPGVLEWARSATVMD